MSERTVLERSDISLSIFAELDSRDVAVWVLTSFLESAGPEKTASVLGLPWAFVLSEPSDKALIASLDEPEPPDSPLVRRRGIIHIVDTNPSDVTLPPRSLPVFLLNGRGPVRNAGLAAITRRLTMLQELKRRSVKHLVILAGPDAVLPDELEGLWADGFRSLFTVVTDDPSALSKLSAWQAKVGCPPIGLVNLSATALADDLVKRYIAARGDRLLLRLRDASGARHALDVTGLDDPEHPLLGRYELVTEDLLVPLLPADLKAEEVESFFKDPRSSWRPFAAGMPWQRAPEARDQVKGALKKLDREGVDANRLFYVSAESGAGATTFIRDLAWTMANEGYPCLMATAAPFAPSGLEVASFMSRCLEAATNAGIGEDTRLYEVPWLVIFDRVHWDGREDELIGFAREMEKSGRRICVLFVTGPYLPLALYGNRRFEALVHLSHQVQMVDALELGRHLNRFLEHHGSTRSDADWRNFFEQSVVGRASHVAAFWIALSFWLQRQFDMGETIQAWLYRQYREKVRDPVLQRAIIDIAAMSTEHQLLPEELLPVSPDWPTSEKLLEVQTELGALGIVRVVDDTRRYWALIHDLLGRFLLTALFYDNPARQAAELGDAINPEHLRLLTLKRIAQLPDLARNDLRDVANSFATSIFKIDPDHGHALFAPFWRETLAALDGMPRPFRTTSRAFLHHSSVSRRRIAKDTDNFSISDDERAELLSRAIADIEAALNIAREDGGESDLNLLNSLAHALHDLADVEIRRGSSAEVIEALQARAREVTRRAYRLNPDNSFVIETYARDLLTAARMDSEVAAANAIEVLGIVYASMQRDGTESRRFALGRLADKAFDILLDAAREADETREPQTEGQAIIAALRALVRGVRRFEGMELSDYPPENRVRAAEQLALPLLRGNAQAVRLRYLLACLDRPLDFALQLELLESLDGTVGTFTPQMNLELAVLLHQRDRHHEAERKFRNLRQQWREGEHFVEVPSRLRWLLVRDKTERRQVRARVSATGDGRFRAKVTDLQEAEVAFRPQEFGQERLRPGLVVSGYVSFGHNGPFLRPLTTA